MNQPSLFTGEALRQAWPFTGLGPMAYDLIMADPPWAFELYSSKGEEKSPQAQYATMSLDAIKALPVADLARRDCLLWLWATFPMLPHAMQVLDAWGFRYVTGGTWAKRTVNDKAAFGTGYVLRSSCEPFLIGKIGEPKTTRTVRNIVIGPLREHSRKPDEAYAAAEELMPGAVRADLFSRQRRAGWDGWGNESQKFEGDVRASGRFGSFVAASDTPSASRPDAAVDPLPAAGSPQGSRREQQESDVEFSLIEETT